MKQLFIFLLFSVVIATGCKSKNKPAADAEKSSTKTAQTTTEAAGNFDVATPKGWQKSEQDLMGFKGIVLKSPLEDRNDRFQENINIVSEKIGSIGLPEYEKMSEKNMNNMLIDFKRGDDGDVTIDGMPGRWFNYSHNYAGAPLDARVYFFSKDGVAYIITGTATKDNLQSINAQLEEVVKSFHIQ